MLDLLLGVVRGRRMKATFRQLPRPGRVFTLVVLAAALAVLAGFPLSLNMSNFRENLAWVGHTNEVLRQLSATERAVLEAESSERGYLLTGDATYLSTYNASKDALPQLLSSLRGLVADNTAQQERVDDLRSNIEARLDELARVVVLGPQARAEALDILASARANRLTPQILEKLSHLRQRELSLLEARQGDADRSALFATVSAAVLFIFALLSATFGVFHFEHQRTLEERNEREHQLREMQAQVFQLARLSTMGEMAASIAHELNQPLAASANYLQGSRRLLDGISDERVRKARDALAKGAKEMLRAGEVIRRLRDFIRQGEIDPKVENVKAMVQEAVELALHVAADRALHVELQFDPSASYVLAEKVQIQQVIVNLVRNAIEAMQNSVRRKLLISTQAAEDGMVIIKVSDTGPGIDESVAPKLFQPFNTSKPQGTGIGLSISRNIIESHGGKIEVDPTAGEGATFYFTLRGVAPDIFKMRSAE